MSELSSDGPGPQKAGLSGAGRTQDPEESIEEEIRWLRWSHRQLEERLIRVENSVVFKSLRALGNVLAHLRSIASGRRTRPRDPAKREGADGAGYQAWIEVEKRLAPSQEDPRREGLQRALTPRVSVLMPLRNPRPEWVVAAIESLDSQGYENWELRLCHHGPPPDWLREASIRRAGAGGRIQLVESPAHSGLGDCLNHVGSSSAGEYIGFLEEGCVLSPHALHCLVEALQGGDVDFVYADEDRMDEGGRRYDPVFKPAWSVELLRHRMYLGPAWVAKRAWFENSGGFSAAAGEGCIRELLLRQPTRSQAVRHVPRVLCHRRADRSVSPPLVAGPASGPEPPGVHSSRASAVICSRSPKLLRRCLKTLRRGTAYPDWEVVLALHITDGRDRLQRVAVEYGCRFVTYEGPFDFARMNNLAAEAATGDYLILLNDDVEPLSPDWMGFLVDQLRDRTVGVVGARLLYPGGTIQHAGMALGMMGGAGHPGRGLFDSECWPWLESPREVSAVTGACFGVRRSVFRQLDGLDTRFAVNYNDVDFCLRAAQAGYRVIYEPRANLRHRECSSRESTIRLEERWSFLKRWPHALDRPDPYFHPCLRLDSEKLGLEFDEDVLAGRLGAR